ncbi:MAG: hypothetical protein U5K31_06855 [Balneolaceae bacterium]|nr:hypothetical protein [Balneolaceae bacterium]
MDGEKLTATLALALLMAACGGGPAEIHYGSDAGAHCKMMIADPAFASQMVAHHGARPSSSTPLNAWGDYRSEHPQRGRYGASFWVSDFNEPGSWLSLTEAVLIRSDEIPEFLVGAAAVAVRIAAGCRASSRRIPGRTHRMGACLPLSSIWSQGTEK